MKKILSILIATVLTGITVSPAKADNPSLVNGMPCVAEVCLGNSLKNLANIKWLSVDSKIAPYRRIQAIKGTLLGTDASIKAFVPYLYSFSMDKKGIVAASHVKICEISRINNLRGTYLSKSGNKVNVEFMLVSSSDGKSQDFSVSNITTTLANTSRLTGDQIDEVNRDLATKYGALRNTILSNPQDEVKVYANHSLYGGRDVEIILNFNSGMSFPDRARLLRKYPGCASPKINID